MKDALRVDRRLGLLLSAVLLLIFAAIGVTVALPAMDRAERAEDTAQVRELSPKGVANTMYPSLTGDAITDLGADSELGLPAKRYLSDEDVTALTTYLLESRREPEPEQQSEE